MEEVCDEKGLKSRICNYGLKNLSTGLLSAFKAASQAKHIFDLNYLAIKKAYWFGKTPLISKLDKNSTEANSSEEVRLQMDKALSANLTKNEAPIRNHYLGIPFFKFFKGDEIKNYKPLGKGAQQIYDHQNMKLIGTFISQVYMDLKHSKQAKIMEPGDNFEGSEDKKSVTEVFKMSSKELFKSKDFKKNKYFGLSQDFIKDIKDSLDHKKSNKRLQRLESELHNTFFEFIAKLVNYDRNGSSGVANGDQDGKENKEEEKKPEPSDAKEPAIKQFRNYDEALKHPFLKGAVYINTIKSDTADMLK